MKIHIFNSVMQLPVKSLLQKSGRHSGGRSGLRKECVYAKRPDRDPAHPRIFRLKMRTAGIETATA